MRSESRHTLKWDDLFSSMYTVSIITSRKGMCILAAAISMFISYS